MTESNLTMSVLLEIRDSIRTMDSNLSSRIDATNARIDHLDASVSARFDVLTQRVSLLETAVRDAGAQILMITRYLKNRTEVDFQDLRERVTKLEAKVG